MELWVEWLIAIAVISGFLALSIVFYKQFFKRLFDFIVALVAMPFLLLIIIPVAIAIKKEDGGPIFYCGKRLGRNGVPFKMIKFRSMKVNAPDIRLKDGSTYNGEDDPRVTKIGKFIRGTSIDELPQFFNILIGHMSLIGHRPDPLDWLEKYGEDNKQFLKVRPGITGYSQAYYRNSADNEEKIKNDNYYAKEISIWLDIKIFFQTIKVILKKENVFVDEKRCDSLGEEYKDGSKIVNLEFGSEFYYPLSNLANNPDNIDKEPNICDIKYLRSGREALLMIAKELYNKQNKPTIMVPDLSCESMIKPFEICGYNILYYTVNKSFRPEIDPTFCENIQKASAVLLMHYYTFINFANIIATIKLDYPNIIIIEDVTHIILDDQCIAKSDADYIACSFRKLIAVEEGGIAISCKNKFKTELTILDESDDKIFQLRNQALLIKNKYVESGYSNKELKIQFRGCFAEAEAILDGELQIIESNPSSIKKIKELPAEKLLDIRKKNYSTLFNLIKAKSHPNITPIELDGQPSFMLPILVNNGYRDKFQRLLARHGVYAQVLWNLYYRSEKEIGEFARNFSKNMLALPIDQRYDDKDIRHIFDILIECADLLDKPKILIVGASLLQLPAIKEAKRMGLYVAVADFNPNAVGIPYADEYYNASTIDAEAITKVVEQFLPDGIMTTATDRPMCAIAEVCKKFNLPCISEKVAKVCTDKLLMIKKFEEYNVEHPWFYSVKSLEEMQGISQKCQYPCIMKPIDNSGSRGVVLCQTSEQLLSEYSYSISNSKDGVVIIEEYLVGKEVSVEVFVKNGIANILQITDKVTSGAPHFVETGHSQPSKVDGIDKISNLATRAVKAVGIINGPAHVEIMMTKDGPKMIELGARMGGDCITSHLVPLSTGINMIRQTINLAMGEEVNLTPKLVKGSAVRFLSGMQGEIAAIDGIEEASKIKGIIEIALTKEIGETVGKVTSSTDRIGYVVATAATAEEAYAICGEAMKLIKIKMIEKVTL